MKKIINNILEKIGFHYVGYKVYINEIMKDIKQLKKNIITRGQLKEYIACGVSNDNLIIDGKIKALEEHIEVRYSACKIAIKALEDEVVVNKISIIFTNRSKLKSPLIQVG